MDTATQTTETELPEDAYQEGQVIEESYEGPTMLELNLGGLDQADEDATFLQMNLDEIPDLRVMDEGEYRLRSVQPAKILKSKGEKTAGQKMLQIWLDFPDYPDGKSFQVTLMLPDAKLDSRQNIERGNQIKDLMRALQVPWASNGIDLTAFSGAEGYGTVRVKETDDYGLRNELRSWTIPK